MVSRDVTKRPGVIPIPEAVIARLPTPYNLIARLCEYLPLAGVLSLRVGQVASAQDNDDGTVTLQLSEAFRLRYGIVGDVVVPLILAVEEFKYNSISIRPRYEADEDYLEAFLDLKQKCPVTRDGFIMMALKVWNDFA